MHKVSEVSEDSILAPHHIYMIGDQLLRISDGLSLWLGL